jgi:hypothetical protein
MVELEILVLSIAILWLSFNRGSDQRWFGALGYGAGRGFVHLDARNGKGWKTGGQSLAGIIRGISIPNYC